MTTLDPESWVRTAWEAGMGYKVPSTTQDGETILHVSSAATIEKNADND